jgi:hypothetical protein
MAMEKEYLWIEYEKKNIFGKLTKYELKVERNKLCGDLNELLMNEFGINYQQFKAMLSEGFLSFEYEDLIERYHEDLLLMYEEDIEEDYEKQLEEEKWYYDMDDEDEEYYDEARDRWEHGVTEGMFH